MDERIRFHERTRVPGELDALSAALSRPSLAGGGVATRAAEAELSRSLDHRPVLMTPSGSSALELAALLLRLSPGDEVIVPSFAFPTTAGSFALRGATMRFADIEPRWLGLDPSSVSGLVNERTRAVVVIHYGGVAADLDGLLAVCGERVALVEDAAHAFPVRYRGRSLGAWGDLSALSFHDTKHLGAGEGGALVMRDEEAFAAAEILRDKGTDRSRFLRGEVDRYVWRDIGGSHLPSELQAALLGVQLAHLDDIVARRRDRWLRYRDALDGWAQAVGAALPDLGGGREVPAHQFHVVLPDDAARGSLQRHLLDRGIEAPFHFQPLHRSPVGRRLGADPDGCPVSDRVSAGLLRLPMHDGVGERELQRVIDAVTSFR